MTELEIKPTAGMRGRIAAVILSSSAILFALLWLLTGGGVGLFARKVDLKTYLPDATGLGASAAVRVNGIQVGSIRRIGISGYLDRQRAVRVDMRIETTYLSRIPIDSLTSINSETMIGDKFLDIAAGKSPVFVTEGAELPSEPADTAADKADLLLGLQNSLHKVDSMLTELASPDTALGHYVVGEAEYDQMLRSVQVFERGMHSLVANSNPAGAIVFTTNLYSNTDKQLRTINDILQSIQRGEGAAGHFYATDDQYNQLLSAMKDLRRSMADARTGLENIGPGLRDEEAYNRVRRMLASTDSMLAALNRGESSTGELLNNPQLYESLVGSLKSLGELLRDFDAKPKKYLRMKLF